MIIESLPLFNAIGIFVSSAIAIYSLVDIRRLRIERVAKMEVKVEALWLFLMRRACAEGVKEGIATINSPLKITEKGKQYFTDLKAMLLYFYATLPKPISDARLTWEIEKQFGSTIVKTVCALHGISLGSCLL